jgi:hypothetical protein
MSIVILESVRDVLGGRRWRERLWVEQLRYSEVCAWGGRELKLGLEVERRISRGCRLGPAENRRGNSGAINLGIWNGKKEGGKESRKEGKKIDDGNMNRVDWEEKETQSNKLICSGRMKGWHDQGLRNCGMAPRELRSSQKIARWARQSGEASRDG